jgi:hypothetical protein
LIPAFTGINNFKTQTKPKGNELMKQIIAKVKETLETISRINITRALMLTLCLSSVFAFSNMAAVESQAQVGGKGSGINEVGGENYDAEEASQNFYSLFQTFQKFAGILLLIGTVLAGIMFITGKSNMAIMVFGGAVVVFGGSWIIGLIMEGVGGDQVN